MPVITLPDEAQRAFPSPVSALEVAQAISPGLARRALAARIDGRLCDLSTVIADDSRLALVTRAFALEQHSGGRYAIEVASSK